MSTPAIIQIQTALATLLDAALASNIIVDRASNEPVAADEMPAVVINPGDQTFEEFDLSTTRHIAEFGFDIYEVKGITQSIAQKQSATVALMVSTMQTSRTAVGGPLGGMLDSMEEQGVSSPDANAPDVGAVTLTVRIVYFTPRGDFNTIIGQSGLFT